MGESRYLFRQPWLWFLWTSCWDHQILWFFFAFGGKTKNQQGPKSRNARVFMCFLLIEMVKKGRSLSLSLWFFRSLAVRSLYGLTVTAKKEINTGWGLGSTRGFPRWLACWTCGFSMGGGKLNLSESSPLLWLYHQCYNVDINGWPTCCMVSLLGVVIKSMRPPGSHRPVHSWFHVESARLICGISWFQCRILMNFGSVKPLDEHL